MNPDIDPKFESGMAAGVDRNWSHGGLHSIAAKVSTFRHSEEYKRLSPATMY
jgi:hypothetical protein